MKSLVGLQVLAEQDDIVSTTFGFLDVLTLLRIQRVCKYWKRMVDRVLPGILGRQKFETRDELYRTVRKYYYFKFKFADVLARTYGWPIGKWNVSQITNFYCVFEDLYHFNENIGDWDVSNATNLSWMFYDARSFTQDLSQWDTARVRNMAGMFYDAHSFNGNVSTWDTSQVENMRNMFYGAKSFHQDISSWNVENVQEHTDVFDGATSFPEEHAPRFNY